MTRPVENCPCSLPLLDGLCPQCDSKKLRRPHQRAGAVNERARMREREARRAEGQRR